MRFQFNTKYIIDTFINAHNWITIIFIGNLDGIVIIRMIVMIVYYLVGIIIFGLAIYVASNLMAISKSRLDVRK